MTTEKLSIEQAEAFIDSLVGWTAGKPSSPHARTHLTAVLGRLPSGADISAARNAAGVEQREVLLGFVSYLDAVITRIDAAITEGNDAAQAEVSRAG